MSRKHIVNAKNFAKNHAFELTVGGSCIVVFGGILYLTKQYYAEALEILKDQGDKLLETAKEGKIPVQIIDTTDVQWLKEITSKK